MTPMCSSATGDLVGWGAGWTDCDGNVSIEYFNTSGVSQGGTLPANWEPCKPTYASTTVTAIVELTQAAYDAIVTKDPNTLYVIIG
jgi:hypothetical protein